MLRRKLLIIFGSLVVLLVALAVTAIWVLQGVLQHLHHINTEATAIVEQAGELNGTLTAMEIELYQLQLGRRRHLDRLIEDVERVRLLSKRISEHYVMQQPQAAAVFRQITEKFPLFEAKVSSLATAQDPALARQYSIEALSRAMALRHDVAEIDRRAREHARQEQLQLAGRFRWLVFGIALGCMMVINVSIVVLLRTATMVLQPVDELVEASRQLARDRFDHRTHLKQKGEFLEIAEAYNKLAERLQTEEQRRMETVAQIALTLNHELNNAIATIEMQLQVVRRQSGGNLKLERCLQDIHQGLVRMAETVESLKHIRRIVLTDYVEGVKMLDLQRSVAGEEPEGAETRREALSGTGRQVDGP